MEGNARQATGYSEGLSVRFDEAVFAVSGVEWGDRPLRHDPRGCMSTKRLVGRCANLQQLELRCTDFLALPIDSLLLLPTKYNRYSVLPANVELADASDVASALLCSFIHQLNCHRLRRAIPPFAEQQSFSPSTDSSIASQAYYRVQCPSAINLNLGNTNRSLTF